MVDANTQLSDPPSDVLSGGPDSFGVPGNRQSHLQPLVTIVTPVYNGADFIGETVDSVLEQGYPRLQYLVLDDGSTDNTIVRLEPYRSEVTLLSHPNMGESRTVNRGLELVKGELICVVNADDPLRPGAIAKAVEGLRTDPDALAFYPDWVEIDARSRALREVRLPDLDLRSMLETFNVGMGPGVFISRRALALVGLRDTSLCYTGDLDFWFRLALHGRMVHLRDLLATHRVHAAAASTAQRGRRMAQEVVRLAERCCSDPLLLDELRRHRQRILARANFAASFHCDDTVHDRAAYLLRSFALSPTAFATIAMRYLRYRVAIAVHARWHLGSRPRQDDAS